MFIFVDSILIVVDLKKVLTFIELFYLYALILGEKKF